MWSNTATGNSGMASGTASWNVIGILLNEGNNIITVTARDAANNSGIDVITVIYTQSGGLTIIGGSSVQNGTKPLSVSFTCSPDGGAPPYTYHWTFGDGGTSTQQNPSHIYNTAGSFEVVVTVTDSAFDSKQWIREIIVNEPAGGGTLDVLVVSSLVAAIASVNVAAIYLIKRRRKRN